MLKPFSDNKVVVKATIIQKYWKVFLKVKCRHCNPESLSSCVFWERYKKQDCICSNKRQSEKTLPNPFWGWDTDKTPSIPPGLSCPSRRQLWISELNIRWIWFVSNNNILHQLFHEAAITLAWVQQERCIEATFVSEFRTESSIFNNSLFRENTY